MAELEELVQRLSMDATGYMTALDQARARLAQTGQASDRATAQMAGSFATAGRSIGTSLRTATTSSTAFRFSLGQLTRQVGEFGTQVAAGRNPLEAFTRNLSQALVFMGPMGAAAGIAAVSLGAVAQSFFGLGRDADEAAEGVDGLLQRLDALSTRGVADVESLLGAFEAVSDHMARIGRAELEVDLSRTNEALAEASAKFDELLAKAAGASEAMSTLEQAASGVPLLMLQTALRIRELFQEGADPEIVAAVDQLVERMQAGTVSVDEFLVELNQFREAPGPTGAAVRKLTDDVLEQATAMQKLAEEARVAREALGLLGSGATFLPEPPEQSARAAREEAAAEAARRAARGRKERPPPTFEDLVSPLERELTLLNEIGVERAEIAQILRFEGQLKRGLSDTERVHLSAVLAATDAIQEQALAQEQMSRAQQSARERLAAGVEQARLALQFAGQESEEYRVQVEILRQRGALGEGFTDDMEASIRAAERLRQELAGQTAELRLQADIAQARGELLAGGRETEEVRVQRQVAQLRGQGLSEQQIADLEPQIRQYERLETQIRLVDDVADTMAQTISSGLVQAIGEGESFLQTLGRISEKLAAIALQATIEAGLRTVIGVGLGAAFAGAGAGAGAGAAHTTGAAGAGFSYPYFGGPRQHGGRVDPRHAFLVGEAGPEMFVPDTTGAIIPRGRAGAGASDREAPPVNLSADVVINDHRALPFAEPAQVTQRAGADGRPIVDVMISDSLSRLHQGGQLDALSRRRGVRRS